MKLTIITINYNNRDGLKRTLESVAAQISKKFEYIVIDGGSTDGSVNVLEEYSDNIDNWISEPDEGIYNAMNKGVRLTHGKYVLFVNSGDALNNPNVVDSFNKLGIDADFITGIEQFVCYDNGHKIVQSTNFPHRKIVSEIFLTSSISHGSTFIKTQLLRDNPYDETLSIVSDWKFFLHELIIKRSSYASWDFPVNDFDSTGVSNTNKEKRDNERQSYLRTIAPARLIEDYISLLNGRTKLERMIKNERTDGVFVKLLTTFGSVVLKLSKIIRICIAKH